jgi:PAS domain S-box-containing protein
VCAWLGRRGARRTDRFAHLLAAAPTVVYACRPYEGEAQVTYIGDAVAELTGWPARVFLDDPSFWRDHIHPEDCEATLATAGQILECGRAVVEYRFRHADGRWRWMRDEMRLGIDPDGLPEVVGSWVDITTRKAAEQALAEAERRLSAAIDGLEDSFTLYDADDRLVAFNTRTAELYPTIAADLTPGMAFETLARLSAQRGQFAGVGAAEVERWVEERMASHRHSFGVMEQHLADGRWIEVVEKQTRDGGRVAIRRDVTHRKRIEEALRQELDFEQSLMDALPYPVFQQDTQGRFFGCNTAFVQAFAVRREQVPGRTAADLLPADQARELGLACAEVLRTATGCSFETTLTHGDGRPHRVVAVLAPFEYTRGVVAGLIGTIIDITEQKRTEEQLIQAAKLATLGQIASEVAHELNQPLSIIRMSAEACLDNSLAGTLEPDRLQRRLSTIVQLVTRMAERVNHLRVFTRQDSDEKRLFAIVPVVEATIDLLKMQFDIDEIAVERAITAERPEVLGHPSQVEQVVLNLLSNARDAVRANRPAGQRRVRVSVAESAGGVAIAVQDNGGGIPERLLDQIFDPFFTTKAEGAGTGLGLSISANIVSAMGGTIHSSNVDGGARFTVVLPVHGHDVRAARPAAVTVAAVPRRPHWRVLVVDDEPLAVECITEYLAERGYEAVGATSGRDALAKAATTAFDLVLTDLRMPGMTGPQLVERIRRDQPGLAAVMMTGHVAPGAIPDGDNVVHKPVVLEDLDHRLAELLQARDAT